MAARSKTNVISLTRVYDAPLQAVWEAWTNPEEVAQWWGPRGFTLTTHSRDLRTGGHWHYTMHGPDGTDYPNKSIFKEIVKNERVVFSHAGGTQEKGGASFEASWTFEDLGGKTRVTIRSVFPTKEAREHVVKEYRAIEGGHQTLGRLEEFLAGKIGRAHV